MNKTGELIEKLVSMCKGSVSITFNNNTTNYETIKECLESDFTGLYKNIDPEVKERMIELNRMVEVHPYPDTPIGFYHIVHYDLDEALKQAIEAIEDERSGTRKKGTVI